MPTVHTAESVTPALSIQLWNFAPSDPGPGGWQHLFDHARAADEAGVDRLVLSEHMVLGENLEAYARPELGGQKGGRQPTGPGGHWLEPLTLFSMLLAQTSHCRVLTGILIAGLRRPVVLAKTLATMDVLSLGRVDIGVGVGWQREEYEACGLAFEGRGRTLDEVLDVCQTLWRDEPARYESETLRFERIHCNPKPLRPGGVPLWISGTLNPNVLRRIARFGAGWIPWGDDARDPTEGLERIREALDGAGRDPGGFQVTMHVPIARQGDPQGSRVDFEATAAPLAKLAERGITDFRYPLALPPDPSAARDQMAAAVAAFRKAVGRS